MTTTEKKNGFLPVPTKVAIVGAGRVGSTYAYTLILQAAVSQISLVDVRMERAQGEAMDLGHAASLSAPVHLSAGTYEECGDADIVMVAAGASQKQGESRMDLLHRNAEIFGDVIPRAVAANPDAILLIATNPVDIMTHIAWKLSGLPAHRVIGSGTVLDTARMRHLLGQHLGVDPRNVHAYVIGEHGDSEVTVWSRTSVAGIPLDDYCRASGCTATDAVRQDIEQSTKNAAYEIVERKGATYYAVSVALLRITQSILLDQQAILPVSSLVPERYELPRLYLSLPSLIGRRGVSRTLHLPLTVAERDALRQSAKVVAEALKEVQYAP